jgi:hypothetical protein
MTSTRPTLPVSEVGSEGAKRDDPVEEYEVFWGDESVCDDSTSQEASDDSYPSQKE